MPKHGGSGLVCRVCHKSLELIMTFFNHTPSRFAAAVTDALATDAHVLSDPLFMETDLAAASVVLFLLGNRKNPSGTGEYPCLVLNKRSARVTQPGDLCCPGGGISPKIDAAVASVLRPGPSPLTRWPGWHPLKETRPQVSRRLSLLFATALREGLEEMRLNPFRIRFLGPLNPQRLILFQRVIFPMVCWQSTQQRFHPNWEVDSIVTIPIETLVDPAHYGIYRIRMNQGGQISWMDFPCFIHDTRQGREILWGATFRMTMEFLATVYGFRFPEGSRLPVFFGNLGRRYLKRSRR